MPASGRGHGSRRDGCPSTSLRAGFRPSGLVVHHLGLSSRAWRGTCCFMNCHPERSEGPRFLGQNPDSSLRLGCQLVGLLSAMSYTVPKLTDYSPAALDTA